MRVGEICNRSPAIIGRSDSIYRAAMLMREYHVNHIIVVESLDGNNIPVGALSDREIVVDMITQRIDLDTVTVGEVMHVPLLLANEHDGVMATLKRMRHTGIRCIPIINEQKALIGILSIENILDMLAEQLNDIGYIFSRERADAQKDIFGKHY